VQWLKPSTLRPGGERELAHNRVQILVNPDVRFGSLADICSQKGISALPPIATAKADMRKMVMSAYPPKADMCGALAHVC
jgi:hypothetical protein